MTVDVRSTHPARRTAGWSVLAVLATGVFALAGAAVGGWVSNNGARELHDSNLAEAHRRELLAVRGSARLLVRELLIGITYVHGVREQDRWLGVDARRMDIEMTPVDLRLIAANVTGDEWGTLLVAIGNAETAARLVRQHKKSGVLLGDRLKQAERLELARIEDSLQDGMRALNTVADAPPP